MTRPLSLALLLFAAPAFAADRPNVLLILTDDQGWGDVHSHGNPDLDTPHLDALAADGARFDRFFVSPVCAPTRAALLTGRYSLRCGVHGVTRGYETMRSGEITIAELLRDAGYATAAFGKWHNGASWPENPEGQGFQTYGGFGVGHWNNYFDPLLPHPPPHAPTRPEPTLPDGPPRTEGYVADIFADAAIRFIGEKKDEPDPWFCYVPFNTPHWPPQAPDDLFEKYADRGFDAETASAYGMVENIDRNVGRMLAALEAWSLEESTVVLFLTDNGPNGARYNGGMRARKGSAHEGGVRVPLFVRYPPLIEPGTVVERNAAHIDLLPTLCELAGIEPPADRPLDGRSLVPLLAGGTAGDHWPDRNLFTFKDFRGRPTGERGAVRTDRWRLVRDAGPDWQLFDMPADPGETTDVAEEFPEVRDELAAAFAAKWDEVTADGFDPIPITLDPPRGAAVLLAHEGILSGDGISYIGRNGWANDWIVNWTDPASTASWPVRVERGGEYEATLLYSATADQVGTEFAVELPAGTGGARTAGTVAEPYDAQPYPSPDQFDRGEVLEWPWREASLGTVRLEPGVGRLTLRTVTIPGESAPRVKAVRLRPVDLEG